MKHYTVATRDFTRTIQMGALTVTTRTGARTEIAPPEHRTFETKAGQVSTWHRKADMLRYLASTNADLPGSVVECDSAGRALVAVDPIVNHCQNCGGLKREHLPNGKCQTRLKDAHFKPWTVAEYREAVKIGEAAAAKLGK